MEFALVALWLAVFLLLLFAGTSIAAVLFGRFDDRGAGLALPVSLAVLWVVTYWVGHVSLGVAPWVGLLALVGAVAAASFLGATEPEPRTYAEVAAVFSLAFLFMVAVRAVDPAVHPWGGEKFLDFGLLQSLLRADRLPPEDMWFAGEPVSYYYGGHLLASTLARLTGTEGRFAYNLAHAGFYATLVTAVYGLAGAVAAHRGGSRRIAGALGAFFVGVASNLSTPYRLLIWLVPESAAEPLAGLTGIEIRGLAAGPSEFSYWSASRVIPGTINEFPLFAWLNGDMHAHMMSTPFLVLVAGLLFAYSLTPADRRWRRRALVFGAVPPVGAMLAVVNTWSFPSVGGLALLTLALAPADPLTLLPERAGAWLRAAVGDSLPDRRWLGELGRIGVALAGAVGVVAASALWSLPFWLGTASGRAVGLLPDRSSMGALVLVHGAFLLAFVPYLARHALPRVRDRGRAAVVVVLFVALAWLGEAPAVALFGPLIVIPWILLRWPAGTRWPRLGSPVAAAADGGGVVATGEGGTAHGGEDATADTVMNGPGFEAVLVVAGAGLALLVEFVFIQERAGPGRLNTVFKTYAQVWVLWSVAAGAALAHLGWGGRPDLSLSSPGWRRGLRVGVAALVVSTSVYGGFALFVHFTDDGVVSRTDDPTLDATAFVEQRHPGEAPAIEWLAARDGRPTIVTAPGTDIYRWVSAPSSLTGVPTLAGWVHEVGYRGADAYWARVGEVRTIYRGTPEQRARLLAKHDVEYVYVGPVERNELDVRPFGGLPGVEPVAQFEEVTIYRVDQEALPTSSAESE